MVGIPIQVSMNTLMVDGTGMCGACRVSVGGVTKFACVDGPEFDGHAIDFDEAIARGRTYQPFERRAYEETCGACVRRGNDAGPADAARLVCGPEFTDKFKMWRLSGGGAVPLDGAKAVVVVTGGEGRLNGLSATRGDRFVAWGESALEAEGHLPAIVSA